MTFEQTLIIALLFATMATFIWGRWRHDLVAMGALLLCVFAGLVPGREAFAGFGHPAVITVGCVLVLSYGLQVSGAIDVLAKKVLPNSAGPTLSLLALCGLAALLSGFMNNVGALALLMPVAMQMAKRLELPQGKILMPLAFASIIGGLTTLIGTPPNLIIAGFRAEAGYGSFAMFDYLPVGLAVSIAGVLFIALIGWRLVPARRQEDTSGFDTGTYFSEVRISEDSKAADKPVREVEELLEQADAQIIGLVRHNLRMSAPNPWHRLQEGDILVIEAEPESLASVLSDLGLELEEDVPPPENEQDQEEEDEKTLRPEAAGSGSDEDEQESDPEKKKDKTAGEEILIQELVVLPNAMLVGRTASDIELRTRHGINLLAISRQGRHSIKRLRSTAIRPGDVLLMRGHQQALAGFAGQYGCLPLAERDISVPQKGQALLAALIMAAAIAVTALGLLPVAVAFAAGVLTFILLKIVPLRSLYSSIDWSVIVLLGAMLPVAGAMEATGTADFLATTLIENLSMGHAVLTLTLILVATMLLTDFMNNAATAALMCPLALSTANQLGANPDSFLMAIAVGASCSLLTPIGHQNNTLILGPGGFRFGDYWQLGLPMEVVVTLVSVPMILWVWPL
ncbi:SLC13 family permease [Geoalkalibacter halelectricus]|uniref:SLC13 family permease n=1 Tax=Geoalkalibacter halelectricus TaxID=2847045 RepID=A0ABY5ZJN2_9BACT|nr:SLC13 family permease [Geoalkalibacter halelectricus]MDO3377303.1 SLC13 family permease [Geoalkalibacter halelectricus]UWZ78941.1 SLC13 family permease [Geoalkalibacter halelectricus]